MAVEAPYSKFSIKGFKLYILVCLIAAGWFAYDGYFSEYEGSPNHKFYKEHVIENEGVPDSTMVFNRKAPPVLLLIAIIFSVRWYLVKNVKLVADDNGINTGKEVITYDSIEKIDKTHFDAKSYFIVTYKNKDGKEKDITFSHKTYDNLAEMLELLVAKIS